MPTNRTDEDDLIAAHAIAEAADAAAQAARARRDALVLAAIDAGVTPYRIAKTLGVAMSTPARMARAARRRAAEQRTAGQAWPTG